MSISQRRRQNERLSRASCETLEERLLFSVVAFTVTTTADSGAGSLRQAILDSNGDTGQTNFIQFAIPTTDPNYANGVYTIAPASALPTISQAVDIDGETQDGFLDTPVIQIDGTNAGNDVLDVTASNTTLSGLDIENGTGNGIEINGASNVSVTGDFIGTDATGKTDAGNETGVMIDGGAENNTIGAPGNAVNIISGNTTGIDIVGTSSGPQTSGNTIEGNWIGIDATGAKALGNSQNGVNIGSGAQNNTIGGTDAEDLNVISGNGTSGIEIDGTSSGPQTSGNTVEGNYIGTDQTGTKAIYNFDDGVEIDEGAQNNTVGGDTASARNIISGNNFAGVGIFGVPSGTQTSNNTIEGNYVGTDPAGTAAVGNFAGIEVENGATGNTIGGTASGDGNLISGNNASGIELDEATNNTFEGNVIGLDASGAMALANTDDGIQLFGAGNDNTIGGSAAGDGNVISGNDEDGISLDDVSGSVIEGNYIGTDVTGAAAIGNGTKGIELEDDSTNNTIGGTSAGDRNVISGNTGDGIDIEGESSAPETSGNTIEGNYIGLDQTGENPLGNGDDGILLELGTQDNTIGGNTPGARNVISANALNGVEIDGTLATPNTNGNVVEGNYIGYDAACVASTMGNTAAGVYINAGASDNIIGGPLAAEANDIVYNGTQGVLIGDYAGDSTTIDNPVRLNAIFGNGSLGIDLGNDGVTANAPGTRSGPNDLQNYPVLTGAVSDGSSFTTIQGSLNTLATTQLVIDFYATPTLGPGDSAQGQTYLGSTTVTTDGSGNASINVTLPVGVAAGQYVTATATTTALAPYGDTSEFSAPVQVTAGSPPVQSGNLVGSASPAAASYNLTALGTSDWAAWGRAGNAGNFDHDATGGSEISNVTKLGPGSYGGWSDTIRDSSWTNGTPTASDSADDGYIWANNAIGAGYSFIVPAGTTKQTLTIYLGGYSAGGTLNAHLSDGSSPDYNVTLSNAAHFTDVVTITFKANSPNQTLTLTYAKSQTIGSAGGSVDLMAAWLAGPPVAPVVVTNPQSQSVTVGTPVTFTAAATATPAATVQWEMNSGDGSTFAPIFGATSTTLSIGTATLAENGDKYEAIFTNAVTSTATTAATLTVSAPTGGLLTGTAESVAPSYNLTALGTADWAHWGRGGNGSNFDHDKTGGSQISNVTRIGPAGSNYGGWSDPVRTVSWTNGTPTASDPADHGYIWANDAAGAGFSFTVPAGTTTHSLHVYFGGFDSNGTISATLSDGSAYYPGVSFANASNYTNLMEFTYHAASPGQTLTITLTKGDGFATTGSVDLIAAWLQ